MSGRILYSVRDFAAEIGLSERTVRAAIGRGKIPASKLCGRWVIDMERAREVLASKGRE